MAMGTTFACDTRKNEALALGVSVAAKRKGYCVLWAINDKFESGKVGWGNPRVLRMLYGCGGRLLWCADGSGMVGCVPSDAGNTSGRRGEI